MKAGAQNVVDAVREATSAGEPDAWWHWLRRRQQDAHVASVTRFADREAAEVRHLVRAWRQRGGGAVGRLDRR